MLENLARVWERPEPPQQQEEMGFFTDTTLCIGCKACEVACKQWNQLPDDGFRLTGMSYDNTAALGAATWRHVLFAERPASGGGIAWKMMSDVCKHCERAGCLEACPTGAIVRTEHGSIYIQPDVCNGCGYCVPACPFGVVARRARRRCAAVRRERAQPAWDRRAACVLPDHRPARDLQPASCTRRPDDRCRSVLARRGCRRARHGDPRLRQSARHP